MGYFIGLPSELDVVKKGVEWLAEEDDYDTVSEDMLGPEFDPEEYAERDDVEVVRDEERDGRRYIAFDPKSDEARRMLEPAGSKPGVSTSGGENMTEENEVIPAAYDGSHADHGYGALEVDARHAGTLEYAENREDYGDFEDAPVEEVGAARVFEEVLEGETDEYSRQEVEDYMVLKAVEGDFDYEIFEEAKAQMGHTDDYEQAAEAVGRRVQLVNDLANRLEGRVATTEAQLAEKLVEADEMQDAIDSMVDSAGDLRYESEFLQNGSRMDELVQQEREQAEKREEIGQKAQGLMDEVN